MPRRPRDGTDEFVFHVFNRAIQGLELFESPGDYDAFVQLLSEALERVPARLLAYAIMPNHWHLVLWPSDDQSLSRFMHWLCLTHAARWRTFRGSRGQGAVYQGRFKAVAVQSDQHLLRLCRYVERNPSRARLVAKAEAWPWSSAYAGHQRSARPSLSPWPVSKPDCWLDWLNEIEPPSTLTALREAIRRGVPLGSPDWQRVTLQKLRWRAGVRPPGRPKSPSTSVTCEITRA